MSHNISFTTLDNIQEDEYTFVPYDHSREESAPKNEMYLFMSDRVLYRIVLQADTHTRP